eukprot:15192088-Alexandrium_andersonii.AAC.1
MPDHLSPLPDGTIPGGVVSGAHPPAVITPSLQRHELPCPTRVRHPKSSSGRRAQMACASTLVGPGW